MVAWERQAPVETHGHSQVVFRPIPYTVPTYHVASHGYRIIQVKNDLISISSMSSDTHTTVYNNLDI